MNRALRILIAASLATGLGCSRPGGPADHAADAAPADSTTDGSSAPVAPTESTWLGINVSGDLPWTDITNLMNPFGSAAPLDANGYPVAGSSDTSSTDLGYLLPSGTYNIEYVGSGALTVSGIAKLGGPWQTVDGEQRTTLAITATPGSFGQFLNLAVSNTGAQTVTGIHIYMPGVDYDTTQVFVPQFLSLLAPFSTMRFMGWENTNDSTLATWADRPLATTFGQSPAGVPFEYIVDLVNATGKDAWINVPEHATDDFITSLAQFMYANLDFAQIAAARRAAGRTAPFQLIVENSNENWNTGFTAYQTFLTAADADQTRYTGVYDGTFGPSWMSGSGDLMRVGQYEADRLVDIGTIFRHEFGSGSGMIAPVLSGWALGAVYSDVGLRFIQANYGDPAGYVAYVAQAPYFSPTDAQTDTLDDLFAGAGSNIQSYSATFADFAALGSDYGIAIAAYEGGQGLSDSTNQPIKHLAQSDLRMYQAYTTYYALWQQYFGTSLFCHFDLAEDPGVPESIFQYGFWGSIGSVLDDTTTCGANLPTLTGSESIASVAGYCPKYSALADQALQ